MLAAMCSGSAINFSKSNTQEDAIRQIKSEVTSFYVEVNFKSVDVIVAKSQYGNEYLKTKDDGEQPNNLLSLAECPLY